MSVSQAYQDFKVDPYLRFNPNMVPMRALLMRRVLALHLTLSKLLLEIHIHETIVDDGLSPSDLRYLGLQIM